MTEKQVMPGCRVETMQDRLRRARVNAGLKKCQVAVAAGMLESAYGRLENYDCSTYFTTMARIARALNVSLDYLAYGQDPDNKR